jgi:hypothetical protein
MEMQLRFQTSTTVSQRHKIKMNLCIYMIFFFQNKREKDCEYLHFCYTSCHPLILTKLSGLLFSGVTHSLMELSPS